MPSKPKRRAEGSKTKLASTKRASFPRESSFTKSFKKDFETYNASGRAPMNDVKSVMGLLVDNDGPLPGQYKDHALSGKEWKGHRECHVHGDLLLVYRFEGKDSERVVFVALGTHSELFGR